VELARLQQPASLQRREPGPSFSFTGKGRTWLFTGSYLAAGFQAPARAPLNLPHSARGGADKPWTAPPGSRWALTESLDALGVPEPLLLLPDDDPDGSSVTWEPLSIVASDATAPNALVYLGRGNGLDPVDQVYLAELAPGSTQLTKLRSAPLFAAGEPVFAMGAHRGSAHTFVFACAGQPSYTCKLARVPNANVTERAAYEFYTRGGDGTWTWQKDVKLANPVLERVGDTLSFAWNRYLSSYLVVHSEPLSNSIVVASARALEGPWTRVMLPCKTPASWWITHVRQQTGLIDDCDQRLHISYFEPGPVEPGQTYATAGEVVLGYVDLQ
jgi:hypothetical protein